mmetsp:Transcript_45470/g.120617  ORF Transcript_45470/g.120617 Transcript_45470/m.120617 type:complete len:200 (+) Transcript_45470:919-1518(+)
MVGPAEARLGTPLCARSRGLDDCGLVNWAKSPMARSVCRGERLSGDGDVLLAGIAALLPAGAAPGFARSVVLDEGRGRGDLNCPSWPPEPLVFKWGDDPVLENRGTLRRAGIQECSPSTSWPCDSSLSASASWPLAKGKSGRFPGCRVPASPAIPLRTCCAATHARLSRVASAAAWTSDTCGSGSLAMTSSSSCVAITP